MKASGCGPHPRLSESISSRVAQARFFFFFLFKSPPGETDGQWIENHQFKSYHTTSTVSYTFQNRVTTYFIWSQPYHTVRTISTVAKNATGKTSKTRKSFLSYFSDVSLRNQWLSRPEKPIYRVPIDYTTSNTSCSNIKFSNSWFIKPKRFYSRHCYLLRKYLIIQHSHFKASTLWRQN